MAPIDGDGWTCLGGTVYAHRQGEVNDAGLIAALRELVPDLIKSDPDQYRVTREAVFAYKRLIYVVSVGQRRDGTVWYAVMVVGESSGPPPEYVSISRRIGEEACQYAADEGDFD